jgi:hypothetical protein
VELPLYQMPFQSDVSFRLATQDNWRSCCGSGTGSILNQHGIHETEDGGVGADGQGERERGDPA